MDTGASCNVMSICSLRKALKNSTPKLQPSNVLLRVFNGQAIKPIGKIILHCKRICENSSKPLLFVIVKE